MDSSSILIIMEIFTVNCLGLVLGSFCTAVTHRENVNEPWYVLNNSGGEKWSFCPNCRHRLHLIDLIPILSWIFAKGRCRYCKDAISARYPVTELIALVSCLLIYMAWGLTLHGIILMFMVPFLIALVFVDLEQMLLPDRLVLIFGFLSLLFTSVEYYNSNWVTSFALNHGIGLLAYPAVFWLAAFIMGKILGKSAIGMGDIKFLFPVGLALGVNVLSPYLILSGFFGVLTAICVKAIKKSQVFPFGPALIVAFGVCIIMNGLNLWSFFS